MSNPTSPVKPVLSDREFFHATFTNEHGENVLYGYNYAEKTGYVWHSDAAYIEYTIAQFHGLFLLVPDADEHKAVFGTIPDEIRKSQSTLKFQASLRRRFSNISQSEIDMIGRALILSSAETQIISRLHDTAKTLAALKR